MGQSSSTPPADARDQSGQQASAAVDAAPHAGSARVVTPAELIEEVLDPVVSSMGYELVHTEFSGTGKHRRLVVYLDGAEDGGFSLEDCSKMAPIVSSTLDAAEADPQAVGVARVLAAPYVLEVSSPGIDRPLSKLSHFARHRGGLAKITTFSPLDAGSKQKNFNGRIEDVQPASHAPEDDRSGSVTLVDPDGGSRYVITLDQIRRANLVYEG